MASILNCIMIRKDYFSNIQNFPFMHYPEESQFPETDRFQGNFYQSEVLGRNNADFDLLSVRGL